jgi:predicted ferric reductase
MTDEALWALGRGTGITALVFLTLALSLGIATRSGRPMLSLPRFAVADVHRFAALAGTVLVVIHVVTLLADPYAQLRLLDAVVPFLGTYRPLWQGLGTLAFDVLAAVVVTSILRHRIGVRAFRLVHWAAYALWPIAFAHALGNGTGVTRWWFLLVAGICVVAVAAALGWRLHSDYTEYRDVRIPVRR